MMSAGFMDNDDAAKTLIKPDFYVQNIVGSYYDKEEVPILKMNEAYKDSLQH